MAPIRRKLVLLKEAFYIAIVFSERDFQFFFFLLDCVTSTQQTCFQKGKQQEYVFLPQKKKQHKAPMAAD